MRPVLTLIIDGEGTIRRFNFSDTSFFRHCAGSPAGRHIDALIRPQHSSGTAWIDAIRHAGWCECPGMVITGDGTGQPVSLQGCLLAGNGEERPWIQIQCLAVEKTERSTDTAENEHVGYGWSHVVHSLPLAIAICDEERKLQWINDRFARLFDLRADEVIDRPVLSTLYRSEADYTYDCRHLQAQIDAGGQGCIETTLRDRIVLLCQAPLDAQAPHGACALAALDISQHRRIERQSRAQEKLDAIGQLAGGVAHDFNNQLSGILGYADILREELVADTTLSYYVNNIIKLVQRAADLTAQLLAFARKGKYLSVVCDMHSIIAEVISLLRHAMDSSISIAYRLEASPSTTLGDPAQLQSAILNLGLNARDAMPRGGQFSIATCVAVIDESESPDAVLGIEPGAYLKITVQDTGCGIPRPMHDRIFEPFFTTKESGTGMGLAAVFGTVKNHNGTVTLDSEPGSGATFTLYLPLLGESHLTGTAADGKIPSDKERPRGKILIIDDEPIICEMVALILQRSGYQVTTCTNGRDAVAVFNRRPHDFSCVILDMIMPHFSGRETFRQLRGTNTAVPILLSSGFSLDGEAKALLLEGAAGFIQKPYRRVELLERIEEIAAS